MFDYIIKFSLKNRLLVVLITIIVICYGIKVAVDLPLDVFPNLNRPTVTIMSEAHGLAPEEVETLVTYPVEVGMNGISGLKRIRSSSGVGLSIVWLEFEWGTDIYENRQLVSERINLIKESLPNEVSPTLGPITSIMGEIQLIGLTSINDDIKEMDLRSIADWSIRPRLLAISGISQVIPIGGGVKQYQILLDSEKIRKRNLSIEEIDENLQHISENTTGGFSNIGKKEFLIRNLGRVEYIEDIEESVVGIFRGRAVLVKDIAEVKLGKQIMRGDASINGRNAVILAIKKQPNSSTLKLSDEIEKVLSEIEIKLPKGIKIHKSLFKQSKFINLAIENVKEALRDGSILVAIILFLFLLNFRTTFITLSAIPTSFAITFIIFKLLDLEINTMTLGGLTVAVGLLVDDAIVDVENVFRRLKENAKKENPSHSLKVVFEASKEVRNSIVFATAITSLAFLPLFFIGGIGGRLFAPLGIAFITSLIASMFVSLTLTPVLSSFFLPSITAVKNGGDALFVRLLKKIDAIIIKKIIHWPLLIILPVLILFIFSISLVPKMKKEFLPKFNEGVAMVSLILPPGISLEYSNSLGREAEKVILGIEGVLNVSRRTGRAELDEHAEGVNVSEIDVDFKTHNPQKRDQILNKIRESLETKFPGSSINIGQPISHRLDHMLSGVNAQIALKVFGNDRNELKIIANKIYQKISDIPGLVDTQIEKQVEISQIKSYFIREDAQKFNINIGKVADLLEVAIQGETVAQVIKGKRIINVFSRLKDKSRSSVDALQNLIIKVMPNGRRVKLSDIADVYEASGPNMINRENLERRIVIQANVENEGLSKVIGEIKKRINEDIILPSGYYLKYDGQFAGQQESSRLMTIFGLLSILGMFILLYMHFNSLFITIQILLSIPLASIGGIFAIYLTDNIISLGSIVAFIALCGIATRNGILMISHYLDLMYKEGEDFTPSMVIRGSIERLVPVFMTAITAILGLAPLLLSKGEAGKEILYPMAVVITGGLLTSTILDIWVTPAVFYRFGRKSALKYIENLKNKKEIL